jgi:hypothetical protein
MASRKTAMAQLAAEWQRQWVPALDAWSRFTQLKPPVWCRSAAEEKKAGMTGTFAMIRLEDHAVVIGLHQVKRLGLGRFALEILAHEIGHHVYTPADLTDNGRLMARVRKGLPTREGFAGFIANLYTDLLINDRLQRSVGLDMAGVYGALGSEGADSLWKMVMRIYELLWRLPPGRLAPGPVNAQISSDAQLGSRLIRVYAKEWLDGAGRFAALCLPYLLKRGAKAARARALPLMDTEGAGAGEVIPDGLAAEEPDETDGALHPSLDPRLGGIAPDEADGPAGGRSDLGGRKNRYRSPQAYVELMKSIGVTASAGQVAMRYYRERALPHLIPFPARRQPRVAEPLPEGQDQWQLGEDIRRVNWFGSLLRSPVVVPGITTVQQHRAMTPGDDPRPAPLDLYLGIDCSGSMPNPRRQESFPVIAAAVMAMSALRAGGRVKAVLSGEPGRYAENERFTSSEADVLRVLTGYLGTGYAFGIQRLADAFIQAKPDRRTHVLVITDSDIFAMLQEVSGGWEIARQALEAAGGGGTAVLHRVDPLSKNAQRLAEAGWTVFGLDDWPSLVAFARRFSRQTFGRRG